MKAQMNLITTKQLAEIINVRPKTLYQWAELGQIPCVKLNGTLRFDLDDVSTWISSCKKTATSDYNPLYSRQRSRKGVRGN